MKHPLMSAPFGNNKSIFWALFLFTLAVMYCLNLVGKPLITPAAPYGIISYELAGSVEKAQLIIDSWDQDTRLNAAFSLGFDYLFMVLYSTTMALACLWGGRVLQARNMPAYTIGFLLGWGLWLAAILDGIENIALSLSLFNMPVAPWPQVAQISALVKFLLIFLGFIFTFFTLIVRYWKRAEAER
jgi:hypothetical protein